MAPQAKPGGERGTFVNWCVHIFQYLALVLISMRQKTWLFAYVSGTDLSIPRFG
jgi:hypothetical protein